MIWNPLFLNGWFINNGANPYFLMAWFGGKHPYFWKHPSSFCVESKCKHTFDKCPVLGFCACPPSLVCRETPAPSGLSFCSSKKASEPCARPASSNAFHGGDQGISSEGSSELAWNWPFSKQKTWTKRLWSFQPEMVFLRRVEAVDVVSWQNSPQWSAFSL